MKDINLRPYREKRDKKIIRNFYVSIIISVLLASIFIFFKGHNISSDLQTKQSNYQKIENSLNFIEDFNMSREGISERKEREIEKIDLINSIYQGKANVAKFLDQLTVAFPANEGQLSKIQKNNNRYNIEGTIDEPYLYEFLENLSRSDITSSFNVDEIVRENDKVAFKITLLEN